MPAFSAKRLTLTVLVVVAAAAVLAVGKKSLDWYLDPMRENASLLEARRASAVKAGLILFPDDMASERGPRLDKFARFTAFEGYCLKDDDLKYAYAGNLTSGTTARRLLEDQEAHRLLMDACSLGNVDAPHDWGFGISSKPMGLHIFSRYVNALCSLADDASDRHDTRAAGEYLLQAAAIAESVIDEPSNRALIVWTSCAQRVVRGTYAMLEENQDGGAIEVAVRVLEAVNPPRDLKLAVRNECLVFQVSARKYDEMTDAERSNLQLGPMIERVEPPTGPYVADAIESRSLQFWIDATNAAVADDGDLRTIGKTLDDMCRAWTDETDPASYLSLGLTPIFEQTGTAIMRVEQMKRIVTATIDVLGSRLRSGSLPERIEGHVDPLTGEPLRYRRTERSFVIQAATGDKGAAPFGDLQLVPGHGYAVTFELSD